MIYILTSKPADAQIAEMLVTFVDFIKLAVDIRRGRIAAGGRMHADCEAVLLDDGSRQQNVWGADWYPVDKKVTFVSMINLRPSDGNSSTQLRDPELRRRVEEVVRKVFEERE
ncbi:MAG: hypothetical protein FJY92_10600 [Candidatus Hydrogenedentes bacterium]|nr:hypothetical protein [Candidatus Hydrogenedentota bacterium]